MSADKRKPRRKRNPYKVGDWVCTFGIVAALHGNKQVVISVGFTEVTLPTAEIWKPKRRKRDAR